MTALNRRAFITSSALVLPGMGAWAQSVRLRCFWWGNPDRDRRTRALLDAYSKGNNIQIAAESLGWGDYWTKLATQVAGGSRCVFGVMVESHLQAGAQKFTPGQHDPAKLVYGQSITDACIGWDDSLTVLETLAGAVKARRQAAPADLG